MKSLSNKKNALLLALMFFVFPLQASATIEIFARQPSVQVNIGDTALIDIAINAEEEINVIEGSITVSDPSAISEITTGGSIISLWTQKPALKNNTISFAGGTPSSVYGRSLKLFTVAINPQNTRPVRITFNNISAYRSDGKGSRIMVSGKPQDFVVQNATQNQDGTRQTENQFQTLIDSDKTPPSPFTIEVGQSDSLYNGKYFLSFFTSDEDSGLSHYEIKEANLPEVRSSEGIYVLQNQTLTGVVKVRAVDYAGNVRDEKINLDGSIQFSWVRAVSFLIFALLVSALFYYGYRRRHKSQSTNGTVHGRVNNIYK